jgi:hypothetical protein
MIAIAAIVGLFVALWGVQTIIGKSVNAADRAVRRKSHQAGRAEMTQRLSFTAPLSPAQLAEQIVTTVNAYPQAPAAVPGLFLLQRSESLIAFAVGSKLNGTMVRARVDLEATQAGCRGTFGVEDWTENGATVIGKDKVSLMRERVGQAVQAAGGSVSSE